MYTASYVQFKIQISLLLITASSPTADNAFVVINQVINHSTEQQASRL